MSKQAVRWVGCWVDPSYEYHGFVRGPDGWVWTFLQDVLVRIAPNDARVRVVGELEPVGWPTFVGRDLYLSGDEQLRRIRNAAPARSPDRAKVPVHATPSE